MTQTATSEVFYQSLPQQPDFVGLASPENYTPLPDDWLICCSDIVDSTGLIAAGKYKTVNMIGASVIAAMQNALDGAGFPYVFGGDGTSFAVPSQQADLARITLARLRHWVQQEFGITLRVAAVPLTEIRAQGLDVAVARFAVSANADYAMFAGGGISWAEAQMKQGRIAIADCAEETPPDLTGLSCRWNTIPARNGLILSLVIQSDPATNPARFTALCARILALADGLDRRGHPVPLEGPGIAPLPDGLDIEIRLTRGTAPLFWKRAYTWASAGFASWLFRHNRTMGQFDTAHYMQVMGANSDYRKFDDGLKMTLDCTPEIRDRIATILQEAEAKGEVRFGLHEQDAARLTCIVPSASRDDHVHFVDGAAGGYTRAASEMAKMPT
ncbi:hypothetical protein PH5382_00892 [Phaeobacter sp. CECT 5382]|uniref:DUF3095 domain-containing protein n=1 Tax=Phaeobacter sp. CECT 5382 TaxID=1712645 RepID=UPI0006DB6BBD|nr:DUF3095 domain-containing protein [Phaeobacter sp. CECT 5382]CUH86973.1 hypothetical protein PH5382_00892 [Phaeobacter sp. CECT 5382]